MYLRKALLLCGVSLLATAGLARATSPVVVAAAAAGQAVASSGTKVHGVVTDPTGALIPGAAIVFVPSHGVAAKATSNSDGTYHLNLAPGVYKMTVTMPGFSAYSVKGLTIPAIASTTMDVKLQLGEQSQVVNVNANTIHLSVDPDNNADSTVITGKALDALSDDPDELESELTALAGPSAGPNGGQIYVDGFTGGQLPPKSSIREIRINQNPFSAEYDRLGYGRIEVFTKPGTDTLHGNLQFNFNPSQFNDGNPLATAAYQPPYHTDFVFGNLTGPLNKNASYNLGGSFRQIQDDEFTNAQILALPSAPTTLCAPGDAACTLTTYQVSTHYPQIRGDINPRIDLALGQKNVLTIRYQYVNNSATNAGLSSATTLPTAALNNSSLSNIVQISDTQTFNPKVINETRFEYEREHTAETAISNAPTVSASGSFTAGGNAGQNNSDHQDHFEVQNYTSIQLKKNFIRMGGRLRVQREALNNGSNTNGQFIYSDITYNCPTGGDVPGTTTPCTTPTTGQGTSADNSYQTGSPSQFTYTTVNNHDIGDTYADLGLYLETDWKPIQNLTVSYGIRYETQNHLSDHHDIAPRVSVSYGVGGKGSPSVVLHGGFGIFYDRFGQGNILTLEEQNGTNEIYYTVPNPTCAPPPPGQAITASDVTACGAGPLSSSAPTIYTAASRLRTPYIQQGAIGMDKQLGSYGKISVNYIHSQGVHQLATQNINYGQATPEYQYFSEGVFNQNQFVVHANVAASRWLSLFGYYSLNSAHGDTSGNGSDISTPGNIAADYGRTSFDTRNRVFLAGSITLPRYFLLSPFMVGQSGNPYNITTGSDNNHDSFYNDRPVLAPGLTPNNTATSAGTIQSIAGCGTFAQPGTVGASTTVAPINDCTGPALFTFNFRLTKTIGFGRSLRSPTSGAGPGGGPDGGHHHGGGGHGGMFGGGASTGRHYNLSFGVQVANLFANHDYSTPNGTLSSLDFGKSQQLNSGFYTTNSALRRISMQASFTF